MADSLLERAGDVAVRVLYGRSAALLRWHKRGMSRDPDHARAFDIIARARGYKHAEHSKNGTPWLNASDGSADAELNPSIRNLRNRSRASFRDDSIATGIRRTFLNNVVGTGLVPQARALGSDGKVSREKNEALEAVWWDRADKLSPADGDLSHGAHQRMVYACKLSDGNVLVKGSVAEPGQPIWFEVIEHQRLGAPVGQKPEAEGGWISGGVEKDALGRVAAYWVSKANPKSLSGAATSGYSRVPAGPLVKYVRHAVERAGQTHGAPFLHACLQDLLDLDLLFVAALKRTQVAACLSMFITSMGDGLDLIEMTAEDYGYQLDQTLEPGLIFRLYPGEKVEKVEPGMPFAELQPLFMFAARRVGASVGISPQSVLKAWDDTSYAGARTILQDDRNTYRCERTDFDDQLLDWEWRVVQEDALLRGDERLVSAGVEAEDLDAVDWIGNGTEWVDPAADSAATKTKMEIGLTTLQIECAKLGLDWRDVIRARVEAELYEAEVRKELGAPPKPAAEPELAVLPGGKPAEDDPEEGKAAA